MYDLKPNYFFDAEFGQNFKGSLRTKQVKTKKLVKEMLFSDFFNQLFSFYLFGHLKKALAKVKR